MRRFVIAVCWGLGAWFLAGPFADLAGDWAGALLLAGASALIGWSRRPEISLVTGIALLLRGADLAHLGLWVSPAVIAYGLVAGRRARRGLAGRRKRRRRHAWWDIRIPRWLDPIMWPLMGIFADISRFSWKFRYRTNGYAPEAWVRATDVFAAVMGVAPVVLALAMGSRTAVVAGILLFAARRADWRTIGRTSRYFRAAQRLSMAVRDAAALLLAASPAGEWAEAGLRAIPWAYDHAPLVLLALVVLPNMGYGKWLSFLTGRRQGAGSLTQGVLTVWEILILRGTFVFAAFGLFHPDSQLLSALVPALAGLTALALLSVSLSAQADFIVRRLDAAALFVDSSPAIAQRARWAWLHDAFTARPHRADFSPVHTIAMEAITAVRGTGLPQRGIFRAGDAAPRTGRSALAWVDEAAGLLRAAESHAERTLPAHAMGRFRGERDRAEAYVATARATVYNLIGYWEEGIAHAERAARLWAEQGHPNLAALSRLAAAQTRGLWFKTGRAEREARAVADDPGCSPWIRRTAAAQADAYRALSSSGYEAAREGGSVRASIAPFTRVPRARLRDYLVLRRELARAGHPMGPTAFIRDVARLRRQFEALQTPPASPGHPPDSFPRRPQLPLRTWTTTPGRAAAEAGLRAWGAGRHGEARRLLERSADLFEADHRITRAMAVRLQLGWALWHVDAAGGLHNLRDAIRLREELRRRVLDNDLRAALGADLEEAYEELALAILNSARAAAGPLSREAAAREAFLLAERLRSRTFIEQMGESQALYAGPALAQLVEEERRALDGYRSLRAELATTENLEGLLDRLRESRSTLEEIWTRIATAGVRGEEYAALRRGDPIGYEAAHTLLGGPGPRVILAEYLVTEGTVLLFIGRADLPQPHVEEIALTREKLRTAIRAIFEDGDPFTADPAAWHEPLDPLVAPLADWAEPGDVVWFVPHDLLHHVPMHSLEIGGRPIAEDHPVCYSPSVSAMRHAVPSADRDDSHAFRRRPPDGAVILADSLDERPLWHARAQAHTLTALLSAPDRPLTGADASLPALRAALDGDRRLKILHVACHGEFDPADPLNSALLLAPSVPGSPDGRLTARALLGMRVPAELVTLSACETGRTRRERGDELVGLTRALGFAGASSVLVSLWQVDELSTCLLLDTFYQALLRSEGKARSLWIAQRRVRTVTLGEVIDYCETAMPRLLGDQGATALLQDIAQLQLAADDFAAAVRTYDTLLDREDRDSPRYRDLARAAARARAVARAQAAASPPPDYTRRPYEHFFYWSAFTLSGDWR